MDHTTIVKPDYTHSPLITGICGTSLNMIDRKLLQLPNVGGVILFSHNIESKEQVKSLIEVIQETRAKAGFGAALILIDHEGGAAQRLKGPGFMHLPSAAKIGKVFKQDPELGKTLSTACAQVTLHELFAIGVNVCLAPVLDLHQEETQENNSRFYAKNAEAITTLTSQYLKVMSKHGMLAVAKHYPGVGGTHQNTHFGASISDSSLEDIINEDLHPYKEMSQQGILHGVMAAHRIYRQVDESPVCISSKWIDSILRKQLKCDSLVFTDCLQMVGAQIIPGDLQSKIIKSLIAGCDFILSSQTPFGSYKKFYNIVTSPEFNTLIESLDERRHRVDRMFSRLSKQKDAYPLLESTYFEARDTVDQIVNQGVEANHFQISTNMTNQKNSALLSSPKIKMILKRIRNSIIAEKTMRYAMAVQLRALKFKNNFIK